MSMSREWSDALAQCQREGVPHVLLSLVSCAGSTPREPGAKMVITHEDQFDTIGGGRFEYRIIEQARAMLNKGVSDTKLERFSLGAQAQQCCGGHIAVLFECYPAAMMDVALFGAGHVGIALESILRTLPWRLKWFDSRTDLHSHMLAHHGPRTRIMTSYSTERIDEASQWITAGTHCIVMTHDHLEDEKLIYQLAQREDLGSVGLIGSKTKWQRFRHRLAAQGLTDEQLNRVRCPIGLVNTGLKRPEEIALSVAAELLSKAPAQKEEKQRIRGIEPAILKEINL